MNFMYIEEVIGKIHFLEAPKIVVEPPGPKAIALLKMQEELEGKAVLYPSSIPFVPEEGLGATIK
ncbi:MAG: aspartate aminotransferase family protein, partial [Nitrososphaerota archaeon]